MKLRINRKAIVILIEFLIIMPFPCIIVNPVLDQAFTYLRLLLFLLELLFFSVRHKSFDICYKNHLVSMGFLVSFLIYQYIVTVINHNYTILGALHYPISILLLCLLIDRLYIKDTELFLKTIRFFFYSSFIINLVTILLFPSGLYTEVSTSGNIHMCYFLGVGNQFGVYYFPGFSLIWFAELMDSNSNNRFYSLSSIIIFAVSFVACNNSTGLITLVVLALFYIMSVNNKLNRMMSMKTLLIIYGLLCGALLAGSSWLLNSKLSNFIVDILGKDITFSSRTSIWAAGILKFMGNPIWGYGRSSGYAVLLYYGRLFNSHNIVLQILLETGIVGLVLFVLFILKSSSGIKVTSEKRITALYIGVITTLIYYLMEVGSILPFVAVVVTMSLFVSKNRDSTF